MDLAVEYKHTAPIEDVESLLEFSIESVDPDLISRALFYNKVNRGSKVLVCHDMKGGYLDDKFVNGSDNPENYIFYHWAQIDIFVYFSHHLVTIPPRVWVDVAHKNGVRVLGTLITEWDKGAEICSRMFESTESAVVYAKQLAAIASVYRFDGWLVNIENALSQDEVKHMQVFLQVLHSEMKSADVRNMVIWYDAVTAQGELKWQDSLTDLNSCFFSCCDGIFLNYTWKDWQLELTRDLALDRAVDVFVGIDVWARGCVGEFECCQSTEKINSYGFSTALFAPAWCYEKNSGDFAGFIKDNNKFWELLLPTCPARPSIGLATGGRKGEGNSDNIQSNFNFGFGTKVYRYGFLLGTQPWFNLSKQDCIYTNFSQNELYHVSICSDDAFEGGTSVEVTIQPGTHQIDRLFCINCHILNSSEIQLVCKSDHSLGGLSLVMRDVNGNDSVVGQSHNTFIGGNSWRQITFSPNHSFTASWVGVRLIPRESEFRFLIGQLSVF